MALQDANGGMAPGRTNLADRASADRAGVPCDDFDGKLGITSGYE
jgi:hypothetical protein